MQSLGRGQPGVVLATLVHRLAVQVGEPGLDIPGGDEDGHSVGGRPRLHTPSPARLVQSAHPLIDADRVAIGHQNQGRGDMGLPADIQFRHIFLFDEMVSGSQGERAALDAHLVAVLHELDFPQEAVCERFVLPILAHQDVLRPLPSRHRSQPRAISSDSRNGLPLASAPSPPIGDSTLVGPVPSRHSSTPRSAPR